VLGQDDVAGFDGAGTRRFGGEFGHGSG
jgi:hypothetical protein